MKRRLPSMALIVLAGCFLSGAHVQAKPLKSPSMGMAAASGSNTGLQLAVPKDVHVSMLLAPPGEGQNRVLKTRPFDIDPDGLPVMAAGASLQVVGSSRPLATIGSQPISDFAWMRDGSLLLITQDHLAGLGRHGLLLGPLTPGPDMEVRPAGKDDAYVFGGTRQPANQNIYLFGRDGRIAKFLFAPAPVTAVAGNGSTTYVGVGRMLLRLREGHPVKVLMHMHSSLISLDMTSSGGLFYATKASVGYLSKTGKAYDFLRGQGGPVRVHGDALFLLLQTSGRVIRFSPIRAFEDYMSGGVTEP